eukprot:7267660-Prymnesium_polylepis.1
MPVGSTVLYCENQGNVTRTLLIRIGSRPASTRATVSWWLSSGSVLSRRASRAPFSPTQGGHATRQ